MPIDANAFANRYAQLNHDEQEVMSELLVGLERGRDVYGPLQISSDPRDFEIEGLAEMRDGLHYFTCEIIRRRRMRGRAVEPA